MSLRAALEMAWHPYFNPATANTRMEFEHLNKPLFIALFKQTQVSPRGSEHAQAISSEQAALGSVIYESCSCFTQCSIDSLHCLHLCCGPAAALLRWILLSVWITAACITS